MSSFNQNPPDEVPNCPQLPDEDPDCPQTPPPAPVPTCPPNIKRNKRMAVPVPDFRDDCEVPDCPQTPPDAPKPQPHLGVKLERKFKRKSTRSRRGAIDLRKVGEVEVPFDLPPTNLYGIFESISTSNTFGDDELSLILTPVAIAAIVSALAPRTRVRTRQCNCGNAHVISSTKNRQ